MIAVKLQGGLGNQLFQYALGCVLAKKFRSSVVVDTSALATDTLRAYELDALLHPPAVLDSATLSLRLRPDSPSLFFRLYRRFTAPRLRYISERDYGFCPEIVTAGRNIYLDGYWQSHRYFDGYETLVREKLRFKTNTPEFSVWHKRITRTPDALSVHIRRGDYVANPATQAVHGVLDTGYYQSALSHFPSKPEQVFVFTDDPDWVAEHPLFSSMHVVSGRGLSPAEELSLMAACRRHIIANSSFSWWGAWLSGSGSVIAPKRWFADPSFERSDKIPENWLRL